MPACSASVAGVMRDELGVEHLVAGGHRRVRGEDGRALDVRERVGCRHAVGDERAHAFDREERGVALVHVEDGRVDAQRGECTHAADAEQQLLFDAVLAIARVQRVREQFDLEQVERDAADVLAPDVRAQRLAVQLDVDRDGLADEPGSLRVDALVRLGLATGVVDALAEVAPAVEQPDADERDAELGCRLQMVAGEDAEAARVDRQVLGEPELHGEVRDAQSGGVGAVVLAPPGGCRVRVRHRRGVAALTAAEKRSDFSRRNVGRAGAAKVGATPRDRV